MYTPPKTHTVPAMPVPESHLPPLYPESPPVGSFEKVKVGGLGRVIPNLHPQPHHCPDKLVCSLWYILRDFPPAQVPSSGCIKSKAL